MPLHFCNKESAQNTYCIVTRKYFIMEVNIMRTKAWRQSEVDTMNYYEEQMYEAMNDFNHATSEGEMTEAFDRWIKFAELSGRKVV